MVSNQKNDSINVSSNNTEAEFENDNIPEDDDIVVEEKNEMLV